MNKIIAHHIGARGFGVSLNLPEKFNDEIVHYLYEADPEAIKKLQKDIDDPQARYLLNKYIIPHAIGREKTTGRLKITQNSYASSFFKPNINFNKYYCEINIDGFPYDINYAEMLKVSKEINVNINSIDELFATNIISQQALPDFISIDTQGYELEVLLGAKNTILNNVVAIVCEVELLPMYENQPLFEDILKFTRSNGFIFAGFVTIFEVSPFRAPLGARAKGIPAFGDALFLKEADEISEKNYEITERYLKLMKLAFIAIAFNLLEYGLDVARKAKSLRDSIDPDKLIFIDKLNYIKFINELNMAVSKLDLIYPPIHSVPKNSRQIDDLRQSWYDKFHQEAFKKYRGKFKYKRIKKIIFQSLLAPFYEKEAIDLLNRSYTAKNKNIESINLANICSKWGFHELSEIVQKKFNNANIFIKVLSKDMLKASVFDHL